MPLQPGTRLGPYEVLAPIGAEADRRYKATDTRTNRVVALRVLPEAVPTSADRDGFARDATVISSLRHPHISAPIEVGHQDPATDFVVMEYVEGETLAARLARGSMELADALQIAIAIADSLDTAHRRGIVHGGLSPSSVMLTSEGPKLLDFGLARLSEPSASSADVAVAPASMASTRTSVASLSAVPDAAAAYMPPERLAGAPPDVRSDIFAAGTVIYEMVTGRPAFEEKTSALLIAAIQSVDPEPPSVLRAAAPAALDHVIGRCLVKEPKDRLQTAWDLLTQLRWIADGGSRVGVPAPVVARRRLQEPVVWVAAAVALVAAAILVPSALSSFADVPVRAAVRFVVALDGGQPPITISPDGRWVAGSVAGGSTIFGVSPASLTPQRLIVSEAIVFQPFWSPDSRSMAFFEQGTGLLKRADISGGSPQTVAEAPGAVGNGSWSHGGVILFSSGGIIYRVLAAGGDPTPVTNLDENGEPITGETHLGPWFLPDGHHFLYAALSADSAIYLADLDAPGRTRLIDADSRGMYAEPGYILFNRGSTIFAQPFDADALALTGEPIRVTDGVAMMASVAGSGLDRSANYSVSQTGALAFKYAGLGAADVGGGGTAAGRQLLLGRQGGGIEQVGTGDFAGLDFAPDGERFAAHLHEGDGGDIWVYDPDQRRMQRLTFDASQENSGPVWSPDGTRIVFASLRDGQWGIYVRPADGSGSEELLVESPEQKVPMSWSSDPELLVYVQVASGQAGDIWAVPLDGGGEAFAVIESEFNETSADISPDGRWMAYASNESGTSQVYITQFPEGPAKRQVSQGQGREPRWYMDGQGLTYLAGGNVWTIEIDTSGATPQPGVPQSLGGIASPDLPGHFGVYHRLAVADDGPSVLIAQPPGTIAPGQSGGGGGGGLAGVLRQTADGADNQATGAAVTVVLNWPQMLEER